MQIVQVLTKVYNVKLSEIALMTPYKAQKVCLKELAKRTGLSNLAIATITESQGAISLSLCTLIVRISSFNFQEMNME